MANVAMNRLNNERGFMLLNVVFLTLITSFSAMILLNAIPRVRNPHSVLKLTAIHLANEQFAIMESLAAEEGILNLQCLIEPEELTTENFSEGNPIDFKVTSSDKPNGNLHNITVKVEWTVNGKDDFVEIERTIRIVPK